MNYLKRKEHSDWDLEEYGFFIENHAGLIKEINRFEQHS